jgi:hypothetical protein
LRFARTHWKGPRRLLLAPAAVGLAVRAGISVLVTALRTGRNGARSSRRESTG